MFDLHCDTFSEMLTKNINFKSDKLCVNEEKIKIINKYIGCFAIWIPKKIKSINAFNYFLNFYNKILPILTEFNNKEKNKKIILTIEGGAAIAGELKNLEILKKNNIKILTLTWNYSCEIGDGILVKNSKGLTKFGKDVVKKLEELNIIIDISHASDYMFEEICQISDKAFIATHSNSRKICNHKRNLTDEQFLAIKKCNGIVGINFCSKFLNLEKNDSKIIDIFKHIENFLSLGGEKTVCIGSDFDGAEMLEELKNVGEIYKLYDFMLKQNYNENLIKNIFYNNAYNFFKDKF